MSEFIERFSPYTTRLPSESFERLPSEAERKLWLVPEAVEAVETQIEEPDLAASWRQVRRNFGEMRQSVKIAKTELRAVGRLAMLDVNGAAAIANSLSPVTDNLEYLPVQSVEDVEAVREISQWEKGFDQWRPSPPTLKDRLNSRLDKVSQSVSNLNYERQKKLWEIKKHKVDIAVGTFAVAASVGMSAAIALWGDRLGL